MARRNYPNCPLLQLMQIWSSRGWVYREDQGWVFDELTPEERAEFRSYERGITIARMRVRLPYCNPIRLIVDEPGESDFVTFFAYCTMPQIDFLPRKFQTHQINEVDDTHTFDSIKLRSYETWLWADEIKACREEGCKVTVHHGNGWLDWGVPADWKPPLIGPPRHPKPRFAEYTFIYALIDELTQEVGYVGRSDRPDQRLQEHLRDTNNLAKQAWIQSLSEQGRQPKLMILEKVAVTEEEKRERYWIKYYREQGHNLTNNMRPKVNIYLPKLEKK